MFNPLVSAIIPVFNGERYLREALDSVFAQDYRPLEVIVIDDGSTDGSARIAQSVGPEVRYHFQENSGLSAAQNKGVDVAQGEFVSFLDSDDLWVPNKIRLQVETFRTNSDLDMVFGFVQQFHDPNLDENLRSLRRIAHQVMEGYSTGTALIKRTSFHRVGPFSLQLRVGEFVDWYARATDLGLKSLMLPDILLMRRIHNENMGVRDRDKRGDYLHVLKAALNRRRQARV